MPYDRDFYLTEDILDLCPHLLGSHLYTQIGGNLCSAKIVEIEAYIAPEDRASHAFERKRTARNETMYAIGGTCYMYICYGIHHLFNIVTGPLDVPHAILVRGLEPLMGMDHMLDRRGLTSVKKNLTAGPGVLSEAMGLRKKHDGQDLTTKKLVWIEPGETIKAQNIVQTTRIGIESSGEAVHYPYRFYIKNNKWVSKY